MARKAAPQPLTLGGPVRPSDDSRVGETVPNSARLPPDTTSPRSPRSPFRLGQKIPETTEGPLQLAQVLQPPRKSQEQQQPPQPQLQQRHRQQYQTQQRPESRDPPPHSPRGRAGDQQQPLGHRNPRHGEDKASKSSFFFNFGKPTKSSDRPVAYQYSGSRAGTMSRDSDHATLSNQSTKHSGTSFLFFHATVGPPPRPCAHLLRPAWFQVSSSTNSLCRNRLVPSGAPSPKTEYSTVI